MLCSVILDALRTAINDPNDVVFSTAQKIAAINEGIRATALYRADSTAYTANVTLVAGAKQSLPSDCMRLLRLTRNMTGSGATTIGKAIRLMNIDRLTDSNQDWQTSSGSEVLEYGYDAFNPRAFWVFPGVPANPINRYVEAVYQRSVPEVAASGDTFPLDDSYSVSVKEWALYVLWGSDGDDSPNYNKAMQRQKSFFDILGIRASGDSITPTGEKARG